MKRWAMATVVLAGVGVIVAVALIRKETIAEDRTDAVSQQVAKQEQSTEPSLNRSRRSDFAQRKSAQTDAAHLDSPADTSPVATSTKTASSDSLLCRQAVETLVSPNSTFPQREAALNSLRQSGKLDAAIGELEKRTADNPASAASSTALGRLYLQKCGTIQDVREQGILAMKADQVFDAALNADPENWEARFVKAVAMSYWPTQMNLGTEVMQHFVTLIEQQEKQAPQPGFAQTYLWLGKEYEKYGHTADARDIWQRGANLFPNDPELRAKLGR